MILESGPSGTLSSPPRAEIVGAGSPFVAARMPLNPPSDDPTASLMIRFGRSWKSCALTTGENTAAVDAIATSDDVSYAPSVTASISGRAIASPVILMTAMRCCSIACHTR